MIQSGKYSYAESQVNLAASLNKDQREETLLIRVQGPNGGQLQAGQRCYFGYTSKQYRKVVGIYNASNENTTWAGQTVAYQGDQALFGLTLLDKRGDTIIENFPLLRLGWPISVGSLDWGGKILRFLLEVDMHASYIQYFDTTPFIGNPIIPLTFCYRD